MSMPAAKQAAAAHHVSAEPELSTAVLPDTVAEMTGTPVPVTMKGQTFELRHGSVVIAAITSCTNTSNPAVMVGAGLEEVYAGQYRRLVALVTAVIGSRVEAEDAVQEAFVRGLGLFKRRAALTDPEAWLYRVAVNVARSRWRRRSACISPTLAVACSPPAARSTATGHRRSGRSSGPAVRPSRSGF